MSDHSIQQAIRDLSMIRQAIERHGSKKASPTTLRNVLDANLLMQVAAVFMVVILISAEYMSGGIIDQGISLSKYSQHLAVIGVLNIGATLGFLIMIAYFIMWRASKHAEQTLSEFLTKNFSYLTALSFVGDLLVKFAVVSMIVLSGKGEWVTPALVLFTGDYLIQGRFFSIPLKLSLVLGLVCFGITFGMAYSNVFNVVYALWIFLAVALVSTVLAMRNRLTFETPEAETVQGAE